MTTAETAFIHRFEGFRDCDSWCRAIVARHDDGTADVVLIGGDTRRDGNDGTSVTNASEWSAAGVYRDHLRGAVPLARVRWYEVYHNELRRDSATGRVLSYGHGRPAVDRITYAAMDRPPPSPAQKEADLEAAFASLGIAVDVHVGHPVDVQPLGPPTWQPATADERDAVHALIGRHLDALRLEPKPLTEHETAALTAGGAG